MNNFLEVVRNGKFDKDNTEVNFEAHYDDYIVSGRLDCETEITEHKEESVGVMSDSYALLSCSFWGLRTVLEDGSKVNLNEKEMNSVKHEVENFFDKLIQEFE